MKEMNMDVRACRDVQSKLDFYIDNELLTETNHEVREHFKVCAACAGDADARRELRAKLQESVRQSAVPADLDRRVRERIREAARPAGAPWRLMAIAAAVLVCVGSWLISQRGFPVPTSPRLAAILRIGFGDHLHCAVIRQRNNPGRGVDKLPAAFKPVIGLAQSRVPGDMPLAIAHECHFEGRRYIHLTFRNDRNLLSLIITPKQAGESPRAAGIGPALWRAGIPLYSGRVDQFQAAAFESRDFIVYTVSDLPQASNLGVLAAFAPSLEKLLDRITV